MLRLRGGGPKDKQVVLVTGGVGYIGAPWLEKNQVHVPDGGVAPLVAQLAAGPAALESTALHAPPAQLDSCRSAVEDADGR